MNKLENNKNTLWWKNKKIIIVDSTLDFLKDIFFVQERIWKDGKMFEVYKLRTMIKNADDNIPKEVLDGNKQSNDPRVLPWMKIVRKIWLDEFLRL